MIIIKLLLNTAATHRLWYAVSIFICVKILLISFFIFWPTGCSELCCLICTYLWICQLSSNYWFLHSTFIPLWSEKICGIILVFLNWLSLVMWPIIWSILKNAPSSIEKNVYPDAAEVLYLCLWDMFILKYSSSLVFPCWFVWIIYCWKGGTEVSYYYCIII